MVSAALLKLLGEDLLEITLQGFLRAVEVAVSDLARRVPLIAVVFIDPVLRELHIAVEDCHPLVLREGRAGSYVGKPFLGLFIEVETVLGHLRGRLLGDKSRRAHDCQTCTERGDGNE